MSIPKWAPGTLYQPGAFVVPKTGTAAIQRQPDNNSFEADPAVLTNWVQTSINGAGTASISTVQAFDGTQSVFFGGAAGSGFRSSVSIKLNNTFSAPVKPGEKITVSGYLWRETNPSASSACDGSVGIEWFDAGMVSIGLNLTYQPGGASGGGWSLRSATYTAPANAAFAQFVVYLTGNTSGAKIYADMVSWDYTYTGLPAGFVFVAVQAAAALSGKTEPTWPVVLGATVVDGGVTWQAENATRLIWQATPILKSGAVEPVWPTAVDASVRDNAASASGISWVATDGRIADKNCPNSKIVTISAAKIFAANGDTIAFSATTNPLDWTTQFDAGFIPFGLQNYGNEAVSAMGLYRSNLIAFNGLGYQMWQIDPDPANMAILDAQPIGCPYPKSVQPVNTDLVFLTPVGIRSIGVAGGSGNLQAGSFGKQVDPMVKALIAAAVAAGIEPKGLFYPGTGQYWLSFGVDVVVLTMNGGPGDMSWSRYTFPAPIDNWTVQNGVLYLRAGNLVWQVSELTLVDDDQGGGVNVPFDGYMSWPYLDFGGMGLEKQLEGFDLVCTGNVTITVGFDETNLALATDPYVVNGDTLPGLGMIPFPLTSPSMQFRLDFGTGQAWEWESLVIHLTAESAT